MAFIRKCWKALYINSKLIHGTFEIMPIDFRFYTFPIIIKERCRHLFGFTFHRWEDRKTIRGKAIPKCAYLSISIFYLPSLDFRIGDGNTWLYIRNENFYGWLCYRRNQKLFPFD